MPCGTRVSAIFWNVDTWACAVPVPPSRRTGRRRIRSELALDDPSRGSNRIRSVCSLMRKLKAIADSDRPRCSSTSRTSHRKGGDEHLRFAAGGIDELVETLLDDVVDPDLAGDDPLDRQSSGRDEAADPMGDTCTGYAHVASMWRSFKHHRTGIDRRPPRVQPASTPPFASTPATAMNNPASVPEHSMAASTPTPSVRSSTAPTRSGPTGRTSSTPRSWARAARFAFGSTARTWPAPSARAAMAASDPMGPNPVIRMLSPARRRPRSTA